MYLQVFFFGPLHKKSRKLEAKPPCEMKFVDGEKKEFFYRFQYSLHDGHELIFVLREKYSPVEPKPLPEM